MKIINQQIQNYNINAGSGSINGINGFSSDTFINNFSCFSNGEYKVYNYDSSSGSLNAIYLKGNYNYNNQLLINNKIQVEAITDNVYCSFSVYNLKDYQTNFLNFGFLIITGLILLSIVLFICGAILKNGFTKGFYFSKKLLWKH